MEVSSRWRGADFSSLPYGLSTVLWRFCSRTGMLRRTHIHMTLVCCFLCLQSLLGLASGLRSLVRRIFALARRIAISDFSFCRSRDFSFPRGSGFSLSPIRMASDHPAVAYLFLVRSRAHHPLSRFGNLGRRRLASLHQRDLARDIPIAARFHVAAVTNKIVPRRFTGARIAIPAG